MDLGSTQPSVQRVRGLVPGDKAAGAWCWQPTPSSAEVKERAELHIYSPSGSSRSLLGQWTSLFFLYIRCTPHPDAENKIFWIRILFL